MGKYKTNVIWFMCRVCFSCFLITINVILLCSIPGCTMQLVYAKTRLKWVLSKVLNSLVDNALLTLWGRLFQRSMCTTQLCLIFSIYNKCSSTTLHYTWNDIIITSAYRCCKWSYILICGIQFPLQTLNTRQTLSNKDKWTHLLHANK